MNEIRFFPVDDSPDPDEIWNIIEKDSDEACFRRLNGPYTAAGYAEAVERFRESALVSRHDDGFKGAFVQPVDEIDKDSLGTAEVLNGVEVKYSQRFFHKNLFFFSNR